MSGTEMAVKNLRSIGVHLAVNGASFNDTLKRDLAKLRQGERRDIRLRRRSDYPDYYGVVLLGPTRLVSAAHSGKFSVSRKAIYSGQMGTAKLSVFDFSPDTMRNVGFRALLRPLPEFGRRFLVMPMNDFDLVDSHPSATTSFSAGPFNGQLLRASNFHIISGTPFVDSVVEGTATTMLDPVLGLPSSVHISGNSLNKLSLHDIAGDISADGATLHNQQPSMSCEMTGARSIALRINARVADMKSMDRADVEMLIQGQVGSLVVNGKETRTVAGELVNQLGVFWGSRYVQGILTALYAALILSRLNRQGASRERSSVNGKAETVSSVTNTSTTDDRSRTDDLGS